MDNYFSGVLLKILKSELGEDINSYDDSQIL